jgi:hypothetical protein
VSLTLTVHRGTRQIGGSCIEIAHPAGDRLILDAGRPLDSPDGATGLLPASLDTNRAASVLISHPHQDHWGLVDDLPAGWAIWTGAGSAKSTPPTYSIASLRVPGCRAPAFPSLKVVVTSGLARNYRKQGREDFIERMVPHGISAKKLKGGRHVVMLRRALIQDYARAGVVPTADDAYNFSMWKGTCRTPAIRNHWSGVVPAGRKSPISPRRRTCTVPIEID